MRVYLREVMNLRDDSEIMIHMGTAEDTERILRSMVIPNYIKYQDVLPGRSGIGAFVLSTFAAVDGVSELDIVGVMPHNRFARASYGDIRQEFEVYPTYVEGVEIPDRVMSVHFDIIIPEQGWTPSVSGIDAMSPEDESALISILKPGLDRLIALFTPLPPRDTLDKRQVYPEIRRERGCILMAHKDTGGTVVNKTTERTEVTRMSAQAAEPLYFDFSLIGHATRFRACMLAYRRAELHDGDIVTIAGDDVDARQARVVRVSPSDPEVEFEFL